MALGTIPTEEKFNHCAAADAEFWHTSKNDMAFEDASIAAEVVLVVGPGEEAVEFHGTARHGAVVLVNLEAENGAADFHAQPFLAGKNCLVLKSRQADDVDIPVLHVV